MITSIRGTGILLLLFAATFAAPGYASAQPPVPPESGAVLYETTENLSMRALQGGRRRAISELLGTAARGSALCPEALVKDLVPPVPYCVLNSTGSDNISLTTGLGQFNGTVTIVVQEILAGHPTPDSPEVVIAKGRFSGKMDFSPAIVGVPDPFHPGKLMQLPLGSVVGYLSLDGFAKKVPFTGVFRLPFVFPALAGDTPLYLVDPPNFGVPPTFGIAPVAANEMAIGFPTVKFEISF